MKMNLGITMPFGAALGMLAAILFFGFDAIAMGVVAGATLGLLAGLLGAE